MLITKPRLPVKEILLVGLLPSFLKKLVYRLRGYRIGRHVDLGPGAVIQGDDVEIGDGVEIGFFTIIRGKTIRLGRHVHIGAFTFLDTPHLELGEETKINEQVFVGGLQFPDSRLVVGRNCQIMQMSFINPARSITIGDDTGIGGNCLLFGHTSWLSKFEGYPVEFDSITIGRSVSLAWRVFVLPGSKVGDGAVIGANSLVRGTIPERCLAVGFPARVVTVAPQFPIVVDADGRRRVLDEVVREMIVFFRGSGLGCQAEGNTWIISQTRRRWGWTTVRSWKLVVIADAPDAEAGATFAAADMVVSLPPITEAQRRAHAARGTTWVDLAAKERSDDGNELGEEVVLFLRRYGVRCLRWRGRAAPAGEPPLPTS